ncbi:hypothetical protein VA7868_01192 [Vibrio aerogenes CECT 7868]|uniref:Porin n=1 Tax=Vibrio aerogenes CECT 7868 TaxID=1216006 RepID=A0A1M5XJI1_9VIBR|nr:carbohydrate porin [Vibrio aerogenes]SHI00035.1 hypothetical protein VA7868_01192 [Vibrio aerogenes CECT 7868]
MKIKTLSLAVTISCACCSLFSAATYADDHMDQKALDAEVAKMEQMHQTYEAELQKMRQMREKYESNLAKMNDPKLDEGSSGYEALKAAIDRITFYGFFRAKYDHDDRDEIGLGADTNNRHFYMDFEAKMKVSDEWEAHFQSEARKGYTVNQSWRDDPGSDDQDGTVQRIWVEGHPYDGVGLALGTKWWGLGFQAVPFGHAADGIQVDYTFVKDWNAKAFWWRPRQGDLISMPNGSETSISGLNVTGHIVDQLATSLTFATNENDDDKQMMDRMGAVELQYKPIDDVTLTGSYVWTNADDYNNSQEYRVDYKSTDLSQVGSYSLYARYVDFEMYGDYSHDDEWASLKSDTKGWIAGVKYVLYKNVVWETFYSQQKKISTDSSSKHLIRTQIDFHF